MDSPGATQAITNILTTTKDISACLTNCSNNGVCGLDSKQDFVCNCFEFYSGNSCDKDLRACSSFPCLKNGTCINKINDTVYDFKCECKYPFYSKYCELKINLCQNITCSKQGWCNVNGTTTQCKCFTGFSGENCDVMNQELKAIKAVSNVAAVVAITCIVMFFGTFIFMDVTKYWSSIRTLFNFKNSVGVQNIASKDAVEAKKVIVTDLEEEKF